MVRTGRPPRRRGRRRRGRQPPRARADERSTGPLVGRWQRKSLGEWSTGLCSQTAAPFIPARPPECLTESLQCVEERNRDGDARALAVIPRCDQAELDVRGRGRQVEGVGGEDPLPETRPERRQG